MTPVPNRGIQPVGRTDDFLNASHVWQDRKGTRHNKSLTLVPLTSTYSVSSMEIINLAEEITTSICQEIYSDRDVVYEERFNSIIEDRITEFLIDKGLT